MKMYLTCCIFVFLSFSALSQEASPTHQHQFGFDAGNFLTRFFNFSGSGNANQLYQATYRKLGAQKNTRIGLEFILNIEGGGGGRTAANNAISFRAGRERFKDFGNFRKNQTGVRAWRAFYGWDFKFQFSFSELGFEGSRNVQLALGPSPFFGLLYRINDRLSLSTELSYDILVYMRDANDATRYGVFTLFNSPTSIFVNYDF